MYRLTGNDLRDLVRAEMVRKGVNAEALANFDRIEWPKNPVILGTSTKVRKGEKQRVLTAIVYMSPEKESVPFGGTNLCPLASMGCAGACLGAFSRRLKMSAGFNSKLWKTLLWLYRPDIFKTILSEDIRRHYNRARKLGMKAAIRLNGSSDILWELHAPELFQKFPRVQFYDYTKIEYRFYRNLPANYHLTFSRSEDNEEACIRLLTAGHSVAIVFSNLQNAIESGWKGFPVYDADETDYRPGDPQGIAGLSIKADAKKEESNGFIIDTGEPPRKERKVA